MATKAKKRRPYWWFEGETVTALRDQLNAAGGAARVEFRVDAKQRATILVVPSESVAAVASFGVLNKSHICPPFCP